MKKILIGIVAAVAVIAIIFLIIRYRSFSDYNVSLSYEFENEKGESRYFELGKGILKYSNDGVTYLYDGESLWSDSFEITSPIMQQAGDYFAVCNAETNSVYVYNDTGRVTVLKTTYPVLRISLSESGAVAAITRDDKISYIEVIDLGGKLIAKGRSAFEKSGQPSALAFSADGLTLAVNYINVSSGYIVSKVVFYDYSKSGETLTDRVKAGFDFEDTVVADLSFVDGNTLCAAGDNRIAFFGLGRSVTKTADVQINDVIKAVSYGGSQAYVVTAKKSGNSENTLSIINSAGNITGSFDFSFAFDSMDYAAGNILMYNSGKVKIYKPSGDIYFEKIMQDQVAYMKCLKRGGYILALASELQIIKLV